MINPGGPWEAVGPPKKRNKDDGPPYRPICMGFVTVKDESTKLIGHRFLNSQICVWIGTCQMCVCLFGVAQHGHSYLTYSKVLKCDFVEGDFLEASDAVIFDVGLFYSLWGIRGCVAEYLDGGFGRLVWCLSHILSLVVSLPFAFVSRPRPCYLWPLLIQQSAYGICLLILLLAALPRILPLLTSPQTAPIAAIIVYAVGTLLNFFLLYVAWHWYFYTQSMWDTAQKIRFGDTLVNANRRTRIDRPMVPKEPMDYEVPTTPRLSVERVIVSPASDSDGPDASDTPPTPGTPVVIVATVVFEDSIENVHLRQQYASRHRRLLPLTPDEPMHGEIYNHSFRFPISEL